MMRRALDLARRGAGSVSPNPMVGAVIVDAERRFVSEGWHQQYGGPHAEANALAAATGRDLAGCTMYVTLEPCSHHGKTPPCAEAVAASGISRVVVAMRDPNPLVSGRGNRRLREAGVEVVVGTLERESRLLNEAYIHFISTGTPFVTIKMAQTLDGYTALPTGESRWITTEASRRRVHELRAGHDAVMVGTRTAMLDNPSLTLRYGVTGRNPRRVTLDRQLALPTDLRIFSDDHRDHTILFTADALASTGRAQELRDAGVKVFGIPMTAKGLQLPELLRVLGEQGIASLLVEGGAELAGALIKEGLTQKLILFIAPKLFGRGWPAFTGIEVTSLDQAYTMRIHDVERIADDLMVTSYWE
ncbi:MAG: bifunctional diaminohydroxyphosphoribosylaminopyrimidine deaminase/5-amino-6-(5-phosphoribosylamino)uracil reductase RibD [Bacteroidetes bacterium]|nr:bifunctional diaminohydroxyphosphoribosylaminopyrimidine deaminase/5-amino-6-(5-phosphoribosylamino)uracil reductase RibD [Bacteroidota bacterium]